MYKLAVNARRTLRVVGSEERRDLGDAELADGLVAGEAWAANATWTKMAPMVYGFVRRALGPDGEVDDVTQEVFLGVFAKIGALRDRSALRSFVFSFAVRVVRREVRRRRIRRILRIEPAQDLPHPATPPLDAESREALRRLYAILDRLGPLERTAFALRHLEGMKLDEVSAALGVSLATTKRRLDRASAFVSRCVARDPALRAFTEEGAKDET